MKLSYRLLIPIVLISFITVGLCGCIYYRVMQQEVDAIHRSGILTTLAGLEDEMMLTGSFNEQVMERVDNKNIALGRLLSELIREQPDRYRSVDRFQELVERLDINEIHLVDRDGMIVTGSNPGYYGRNITEMPENADLLNSLDDPMFAVAQTPRVNSAGLWIQYYVVTRTDEPGLILIGIQYSVATMIQQTFTDGINADLTRVGETGFIAILHDGIYAAHPNPNLIGLDATDTDWYAAVSLTDRDIQWLEIDGAEYLTGHVYYEDSLLLAMLPAEEYYASLQNMRTFTILLVFLSGVILIGTLFFSVRRNVLHPVQVLSDVVNRMARGNLDVNAEGRFTGEMEQLRRDVNKTIMLLRSRQDHVVNNFPGVIWSCDASFKCTLFAGQSMDRLGFRSDDYLGQSIMEIAHSNGDEDIARMIEQTFATGEFQRLNQERMGRYLSVTTSLMHDEEGNMIGLVGVCADVTDLRELQEQLIQATEEANRASQAKSEFLSRMSHEIRTPMNAIIGMNTIAKKSGEPEKIRYCLEKIQAASDQLLNLINDILDMSKIEANKFELSISEFDFDKMLQNVCNVAGVRASEKKQDFIIDFPDVFSRNVVSDELRLSQVLINLLNNAVKFTPEDGQITLKIRCHEIDDSFGRFTFDVVDNGIGISQEQQKRLFTSFEQADGSITRRYGGTGLGLAISRSIIQMMGGDIELTSEPDIGSCFSFSVNMAWGNQKDTRDLVHRLPPGDYRLLVIDDSEEVCLYFEHILEHYGLGCDSASSGPEGIQRVSASLQEGRPYNLIFVDWMMPGMDGIETARHIKNMTPPDTIVIMISVADWSEIEREANRIGVDRFLSKPVLPTVLFQSIVNWLNTAAMEQAPASAEQDAVFSGRVILLAEDIDINREIIIGMLEGTGVQVECAGDGRQALELYLAAPDRFDLVLMDIHMPGMDGYEATRQIRECGVPGCKSLPIIAMTANAFKSDVEKCLEAGMNDHIAKPVDMEELFGKLEATFRSSPTMHHT